MVEDADELQNFGVRHTLELLRRMMNQSGRPIADQPPPDYSEFDKYPLATEEEPVVVKSTPQPSRFETTLAQRAASYPSPLAYDVAISEANSVDPSSRPSTWIEPFPKPPGEPPPVPTNWLYSRLSSIRQSLVARFGSIRERQSTTATVQSPAELPPRTGIRGDGADEIAEISQAPSRSVSQHESTQSINAVPSETSRRSSSTQSYDMSNSVHAQSERTKAATLQSSVDTSLSQEHVIVLTRPEMHRKSKSVIDLSRVVEFEPSFKRKSTL